MYWDLLLLINLVVNYFILLITARLFHKKPGALRLLLGAAAGALAILVLRLPAYPALTVAATIVTPVLMIILVFWPLRRLELFLLWCSMFLVSFLTGGAVLALSMLNRSGNTWEPPRGAASLILVCLLLYAALSFVRPYLEERKWQKLWQMELLISWQGKEKAVRAYLDSGNRLREPLSQRAVIVIHYLALKEMLPPAVCRCLSDAEREPWEALPGLEQKTEARSFTLVPYRGLGGRQGVLLGFKPDAVIISRGGRRWPVEVPVVMGLTRHGFGPVAEYEALLPPELLKGVEGCLRDAGNSEKAEGWRQETGERERAGAGIQEPGGRGLAASSRQLPSPEFRIPQTRQHGNPAQIIKPV
ncbi:MAG TPA: sigma-E processing peptidase SpoIIGA [Bacillota bacterium]|nr:sigma-E processing peptidase SpoIIGA [Bacillota bacterium]